MSMAVIRALLGLACGAHLVLWVCDRRLTCLEGGRFAFPDLQDNARLSAVLLCLAGPGGWRTMWRDARKHASPNAGWPEAAMAGVLGLRLAGPIAYDGGMHLKPWIGDGRAQAKAADITYALALCARACLLLWVIAGGIAWAL